MSKKVSRLYNVSVLMNLHPDKEGLYLVTLNRRQIFYKMHFFNTFLSQTITSIFNTVTMLVYFPPPQKKSEEFLKLVQSHFIPLSKTDLAFIIFPRICGNLSYIVIIYLIFNQLFSPFSPAHCVSNSSVSFLFFSLPSFLPSFLPSASFSAYFLLIQNLPWWTYVTNKFYKIFQKSHVTYHKNDVGLLI